MNIRVVAAISLLLTLAGCNQLNPFVGRWSGQNEVLQIYANGVAADMHQGMMASGAWKQNGPDSITVSLNVMGSEMVATATFQGGDRVLTAPDGSMMGRYTRVQTSASEAPSVDSVSSGGTPSTQAAPSTSAAPTGASYIVVVPALWYNSAGRTQEQWNEAIGDVNHKLMAANIVPVSVFVKGQSGVEVVFSINTDPETAKSALSSPASFPLNAIEQGTCGRAGSDC